MADFNMTVTVSGLKLLTDALAGKMVTLTGIHLGSGSYTGNLSAATQLVQEQIALPLDKIIKGNNQITAKSVLQFRTVETGFIWTEVGLFAKESDGPEILYAYGYAGNKGDYIPGADEATLNEKVIRLTMLSSNEANIVAEVDGSTVYASQEDLDDLRESVELSIINITNIIQQVTGVDPSDPDAEPPSGSMVVTLTHTKSDTVHAFTGLGERTGLVPCQFKATAGYTEGDTATIDGIAYTIQLTGEDAPETGLFVAGKSVLIDIDTEGKTINFKAGGGLTGGKLKLATAEEDEVFAGKTFYAGGKELRTGTALSEPITAKTDDVTIGMTYYDQTGALRTGTRKKKVQNVIYQSDDTFVVPEGVTSISVRIFGGGGSGYSFTGGGGGGGHMAHGEFSVTPGQKIPVTIGLGGYSSPNTSGTGGTSSFGTLISAAGGSPGTMNKGGNGGSGGGGLIGGDATYGGGGGSGALKKGGNGGTYGGGGGGGGGYQEYSSGSWHTTSAGGGGSGGQYGGSGGSGAASGSGSYGAKGTNTTGLELDFTGTGNGGYAGSGWTSSGGYTNPPRAGGGGGGGGGYGGNGGGGSGAYGQYGSGFYGGAGGGGGGYGGNGGTGAPAGYGGAGGGGGGYGGNGGASRSISDRAVCGGGGGGYGKSGNGGTDGSAGGIAAGGSASGQESGSNNGKGPAGGNGICIVTYLE